MEFDRERERERENDAQSGEEQRIGSRQDLVVRKWQWKMKDYLLNNI